MKYLKYGYNRSFLTEAQWFHTIIILADTFMLSNTVRTHRDVTRAVAEKLLYLYCVERDNQVCMQGYTTLASEAMSMRKNKNWALLSKIHEHAVAGIES